MSTDEQRARREALAWWIRLSEDGITHERLSNFAAWRAKPGNVAAYRQVEREAKERAARVR